MFADDELSARFEELVELADSIFRIRNTAKTVDLKSTVNAQFKDKEKLRSGGYSDDGVN